MDGNTKDGALLRVDRGRKKCFPCVRVGVWLSICSALTLLVLLLAFMLWTLFAYHRTVVSLQSRIDKLEQFVEGHDAIVETKVNLILQQVGEIRAYSVLEQCGCPFCCSTKLKPFNSLPNDKVWTLPN